MLLEIRNIVKYYGEKKILGLERLSLNEGDRLAITGRNGSGKTTLLRIITGEIKPDSGNVALKSGIALIPQIDKECGAGADRRIAGKLGLTCEAHSGGEKVKERIAKAFSQGAGILLADEPTTNLDMTGIRRLEELLTGFRGGLIIVSHDRALLKKVCTRVLEIERGACALYNCGYEDYLAQKELEKETHRAQYRKYSAERDRLKSVAVEKAQKSARVKRAPKRMGNSEARLHKTGDQKAKANLDRAAKAAFARLGQLEKVQKPWDKKDIVFDVKPGEIHSPVLVRFDDVSKSYGERQILQHCSFVIPNNQKTAIIGDNGTGKTTLLDMIAEGHEGVEKSRNLKIGYFRQDTSDIADKASVLENVMAGSVYREEFVRTILSRLLFERSQVLNKAGVLSGGERIKLAIAMIILSDFNLLVLDEPTNYLDIESRDSIESVLAAYPGAVLFVSHDRDFVRNVADRIILLENKTAYTLKDKSTL